jgi:hypothetical protein
MRTLIALVVLGTIGAAPAALAEAWRAKPELEQGAPSSCREADVSNLFFDFLDTGSDLSLTTNHGEAFAAPIAADGYVKTTLTVPVGNRKFAVDLTGNVKTREMELFNKQYSCRFRLMPVQ